MKRKEHKIINNIELKQCGHCKEWLPLNCFTKRKINPDGLYCYCRGCCKQYCTANIEKIRKQKKQYRIEHKEEARQWCRDNKDIVNAKTAKYRADQKKLTPPDANLKAIRFTYSICAEWNRLQLNGFTYEVDHIKPKAAGGLHHEDNLQILEVSLNRQKKDKWPLSPEEKIKYMGYKI